MGIGARIRQARMGAMKSVAHLAKLCETDLATVNGWENESIEFPREFIYRIAQDLNVSIAWLEKDEGPAEVEAPPADAKPPNGGGLLSAPPVVSRLPMASAGRSEQTAQAAEPAVRRPKGLSREDVGADGEPGTLRESLLESLASCATMLAADPANALTRRTMKDILQALDSYEALSTALTNINGGRR